MDKRKIIPIVFVTFLVVGGLTGYNYINNQGSLVINNINIKDISKIKENEIDGLISRNTEITNDEKLKKYNKIEVSSFNCTLDKKKQSYVVDINFKNISQDIINDLELNFTLFGVEDRFHIKKFKNKELKPNEEFNILLNLTAQNVLDVCIKESESKNLDNFKEIFEENSQCNALYLGYDYTYKNEVDNNLLIKNELNFDGVVSHTSLSLVPPIIDGLNLPKTHVESGSYLNLVEPEEKNPFNLIHTLNINVEIDDDFNFKIIGEFQNVGTDNIETFSFQPTLTLFNFPVFYEKSTVKQDKEVIEPGEKFKSTVFIDKEDLIFSENISEMIDNKYSLKFKKGDSLLKALIKNRLFSIGYSYQYAIGEYTTSVNTMYTNNSKLLEMNLFECVTPEQGIEEDIFRDEFEIN